MLKNINYFEIIVIFDNEDFESFATQSDLRKCLIKYEIGLKIPKISFEFLLFLLISTISSKKVNILSTTIKIVHLNITKFLIATMQTLKKNENNETKMKNEYTPKRLKIWFFCRVSPISSLKTSRHISIFFSFLLSHTKNNVKMFIFFDKKFQNTINSNAREQLISNVFIYQIIQNNSTNVLTKISSNVSTNISTKTSIIKFFLKNLNKYQKKQLKFEMMQHLKYYYRKQLNFSLKKRLISHNSENQILQFDNIIKLFHFFARFITTKYAIVIIFRNFSHFQLNHKLLNVLLLTLWISRKARNSIKFSKQKIIKWI